MNKIQRLIAVLCMGILILSGCDDNMSLVGNTLIPDTDKITIYADTFQIQASTVKRDSLFAKTTNGLLGEYYDPLYGQLKSDYLCQFYCEDGFQFYNTPYNNKIDSIYIRLDYIDYMVVGNPNIPMQIQVFPVTKPLDKVYHTNVDPADYCDLTNEIGSLAFSASGGTIIDSTSYETDIYYYRRRLEIRLPVELGQKIYDESVNNPASFKNQQAFNDFFPGIYITTGYGSGSMLEIQKTDICVDYHSIEVNDATGKDSLLYYSEVFMTTKEVIQLNRFENSDTEQLLAENEDYTFVKTPAGIYTRFVLPATEIKPVIEGRMINSMLFSIKYMPNEDWPYSLSPPPFLLLMPEDSLSSFFQNRNIENSITTFISSTDYSPSLTPLGYSPTTRTYYFHNIANLLSYHLATTPDEDLRLLVVPVNRIAGYNSNYGMYYTTEINNYLAPSGVKLRKDQDLMKIAIITSKYEN